LFKALLNKMKSKKKEIIRKRILKINIGNIILIFSALSVLSKLDSLQELFDLILNFWQDLKSIYVLISKVVHFFLAPYNYLVGKIVNLFPFFLSKIWLDALIIVSILCLDSYKYYMNTLMDADNKRLKQLFKSIKRILKHDYNKNNLDSIISKIEHRLSKDEEEFTLDYKVNFISNSPIGTLLSIKEEEIDDFDKERIIKETIDFCSSSESELSKRGITRISSANRLKLKIGLFLFLSIFLDTIYTESFWQSLVYLLRVTVLISFPTILVILLGLLLTSSMFSYAFAKFSLFINAYYSFSVSRWRYDDEFRIRLYSWYKKRLIKRLQSEKSKIYIDRLQEPEIELYKFNDDYVIIILKDEKRYNNIDILEFIFFVKQKKMVLIDYGFIPYYIAFFEDDLVTKIMDLNKIGVAFYDTIEDFENADMFKVQVENVSVIDE